MRQHQVQRVAAQLRRRGSHSGVVVVGGAGVGKTTLARNALRAARGPVRWVAASETARGIPLGAFAHLVDAGGESEPHTIVRAARERLLSEPNALIGVDDAHMLDELSATVVHQLAIEHAAGFVVTVRTGTEIPDAVTALWKDDLLARVDLTAFTRDEVAAVVEAALGGPVESVSIDRLYRTSQGNPLYLRHLVEGAVATEHLRRVAGVWQLRGATVITQQLSALVSARLADLPALALDVGALLAFGGTLDVDTLAAMRDRKAIEEAERAGIARVGGPPDRLTAALSHPIYGEVIRDRTGVLDAQRIRGELVRTLSAAPLAHVSDRIRLVTLAIDSDEPPTLDDLLDAAADALRLGDVVVAARFARRATELGGDVRAVTLLAAALAWQGQGEAAEAELAAVDDSNLGELELMVWAIPRASNLYWVLGDSAAASTLVENVRARVSVPLGLDFLEMFHATFTDRLPDALRAAREVLASPLVIPLVHGWAAFTAASASSQMGRLEEVAGLVEEGLDDATRSTSGLLRFNLGLAEIPALLAAGPVADAEAAARRYLELTVGQQPARGKAGVLLGTVYLRAGRLAAARSEFTEAIAALRGVGYVWEFLASASLCETCAALGDTAAAKEALARAERLVAGTHTLFDAELRTARGWVAAAQGLTSDAIGEWSAAADAAIRSSRTAVAAEAMFAAVRLGDVAVAPRLAQLAADVDGEAVQVQARQAAALAAADGAGLLAVAVRWEELGAELFAADAAASAAAVYTKAGDRRGKVEAAGMAARLAQQCDDAKTPALVAEANPLPLTARERETASMVALGLSNKEIADRLTVSVRTVEGHIYRACTKLNVPDREALAHAITRVTGGGGDTSK